MRIYRVLSQNEFESFENGGSLLLEHHTVHSINFFMNPHPENEKHGKFFFFTLEDAVTFAKNMEDYHYDNNILEMEVDKQTAYEYLGVGCYNYVDTSIADERFRSGHFVPELLLPYQMVAEN